MKVIITTAGTGSRLGERTQYLNKSLVKLGDKAIINHIMDSYGKNYEFVIVVGHLGQQVIDYVKLCYQEWNIRFAWVDSNNRNCQLNSLLTGIDTNEPFIYNACDTYSEYAPDALSQASGNTILIGGQLEACSNYDCIDEYGIFRKKGFSGFPYIGIAYIADVDRFITLAKHTIEFSEEEPNDFMVYDQLGVDKIHMRLWYDVGNIASFEKTSNDFEPTFYTSTKYDRETYFHDGNVIKFYNNKDVIKNLAYRMNAMRQSCVAVGNFIRYKFVEGVTLDEYCSTLIFDDILNHLRSKKVIEIGPDNFYVKKAKERVDRYLGSNTDFQVINGVYMPDIITMLDKVNLGYLSFIDNAHGDFVLPNIVITKDYKIHYIDIRPDFGDDDFGCLEYEYAKLRHSLMFDHRLVDIRNFKYEEDGLVVNYDVYIRLSHYNYIRMLDNNANNLRTIHLMQALVWLSMSGLHKGIEARLLFAMGKELLYKTL